MTLATAEMQFSVALTFSFTLDSGDWITATSSGTASGRTHVHEYNMRERPMISMKQNPLINSRRRCHDIWLISEVQKYCINSEKLDSNYMKMQSRKNKLINKT